MRTVSRQNLRVIRWILGAVAAIVVVTAFLILIGPLSWWLVRVDVSQLPAAQLTMLKDTRTLLVQAVGGLLVATGLAITARTYILTREGQVTSRFGQAIGLLGSEQADVRVGAIFALERIATDSPRDQQTIVETLQTFLRAHAAASDPAKSGTTPASDVQAAARVLTRPVGRQPLRLTGIDLSGAELTEASCIGADLSGSRLASASLRGARLDAADLSRADLSGSQLSNAVLEDAICMRADLSDTDLTKANLRSALLHQVHLRGALLLEASLVFADLYSADLRHANLAGADLRGAILIAADLRDADLSGANIQDADFSEAKLDGARLYGVDVKRAASLSADQVGAASTDPAPASVIGRKRS